MKSTRLVARATSYWTSRGTEAGVGRLPGFKPATTDVIESRWRAHPRLPQYTEAVFDFLNCRLTYSAHLGLSTIRRTG